jgi:Fic family protein
MKKEKTTKKSITLQAKPLAELGRRCGTLENHLSQQVNNDLLFFHALLDLLGMEAMIEGRFSEAEVRALLAATEGITIEPGRLAGISCRINAALAEHTTQENHPATVALMQKIGKLSVSTALWLWDRLTVYRANDHRHHDREYLVSLFGVR